jgi:hypothetical protein
MEKKWRVGHVELLEGGALFGFVLYDQKDRPCVSIGYSNDVEAFAGRDLVLAALKDAEEVLGRWVRETRVSNIWDRWWKGMVSDACAYARYAARLATSD